MSPNMNRIRRPAPLQLTPSFKIPCNDTNGKLFPISGAASASIVIVIIPATTEYSSTSSSKPRQTPSPNSLQTTSRPASSKSRTVFSTAQPSSPVKTSLITIIRTIHSNHTDTATPPPVTETIFLSDTPQTVFITPSTTPTSEELAQLEGIPIVSGASRPVAGKITGNMALAIVGILAMIAVLASLATVLWRKRKQHAKDVLAQQQKQDLMRMAETPSPNGRDPFRDPLPPAVGFRF